MELNRLHSQYPQASIEELETMIERMCKKDIKNKLLEKYGPPKRILTRNEKIAALVMEFEGLDMYEASDLLSKHYDDLENTIEAIKDDKELENRIKDFKENTAREIMEEEMKERLEESNECMFDLHKYSLQQARNFFKMFFRAVKNDKITKAKLIVGKGIHSKNNIAQIRALAMKEAINKHRMHAEIDKRNTGVVIIYPEEETDEEIDSDYFFEDIE
jgi:hypothetical protein